MSVLNNWSLQRRGPVMSSDTTLTVTNNVCAVKLSDMLLEPAVKPQTHTQTHSPISCPSLHKTACFQVVSFQRDGLSFPCLKETRVTLLQQVFLLTNTNSAGAWVKIIWMWIGWYGSVLTVKTRGFHYLKGLEVQLYTVYIHELHTYCLRLRTKRWTAVMRSRLVVSPVMDRVDNCVWDMSFSETLFLDFQLFSACLCKYDC